MSSAWELEESSRFGKANLLAHQREMFKSEWSSYGVTRDICQRSMNRLKRENIDFNEVLRANTGTWADDTFSFPDAIFWKDMRPTDPRDS